MLVLNDCENGFWSGVKQHVQDTQPIFNMLRRHDSSAPTVGKVFQGWFDIGENIKKSTAPYKEEMQEKHQQRWDYGDVPFFTAAYVLDPEYINCNQTDDEHIMTGFMDVVERIAILAEVRKDEEKYKLNWEKRRQMIIANPDDQKNGLIFQSIPMAATLM